MWSSSISLLIWLTIVEILHPVNGGRTCRSKWVEIGDSCYQFVTTATSFSTASLTCRRQAAHLVVFESEDEIINVKNVILNSTALNTTSYWIGYSGRKSGSYNIISECMYDPTFLWSGVDKFTALGASALLENGAATFEAEMNLNYQIVFRSFSKFLTGRSYEVSYICEREKKDCRCGRWNEPVVRDFDGRSIPLMPTCRYTLIELGNWKVDIVLKHQIREVDPIAQVNARISYGRLIDYVEIVNTLVNRTYIMRNIGSLSEIMRSNTPLLSEFQSNGFSDDLVDVIDVQSLTESPFSSENPLIVKPKDVAMQIALSNSGNVEIKVDFDAAQNTRGLCGKCSNDPAPDPPTFLAKDGTSMNIPLLYAQTYMDQYRKCLANMAKPAACVSHNSFQKALERCSPLQSPATWLNVEDCIPKLVDHFAKHRTSLFTACVSSVCEFGPKAGCYYFIKALEFCGLNATVISAIFSTVKPQILDCSQTDICPLLRYDTSLDSLSSTAWNGTCYMLSKQDAPPLNGFRGEGFCQTHLFNLASIESMEEQIHVFNLFGLGATRGKNGTDKALWLGRTSEDKFHKQGTFDARSAFYQPDELLKQTASGKCVYLRGTKSNPGWQVTTCSEFVNGALCMSRSFTYCNTRPCFYPNLCDQVSGTCYDPCFDEGFILGGQCYKV